MRDLAIILAFVFLGTGLLVLSCTTIRYHVTARCLRITWLGLPVRWVRLLNIKHIGTQRLFWAEKWCNTLSPGNRYLVIHKKSGLLKNLVITPKNHFVFKAELDRARVLLVPPAADPLPSSGGQAIVDQGAPAPNNTTPSSTVIRAAQPSLQGH